MIQMIQIPARISLNFIQIPRPDGQKHLFLTNVVFFLWESTLAVKVTPPPKKVKNNSSLQGGCSWMKKSAPVEWTISGFHSLLAKL